MSEGERIAAKTMVYAVGKKSDDDVGSEHEFEQRGSDKIFKPLMSRIASVGSDFVNDMDEETRLKLKKRIGLKSPEKSILSDLYDLGEQPLIGEKR